MKSIWSTEAVTTTLRQCFIAAIAPARSTRCMILPPSRLPRPLASLGSASSEYSATDSLTRRPSMSVSGLPAVLQQVCGGIDTRLAFQRSSVRCVRSAIHSQRSHRDRVMVALARPRDVDDAVPIGLDREAKNIGLGLRGAPAGIARVTGVAALAQNVYWYKCTGFGRALTAIEIGEAVQRRCRHKQRASHTSTL